jgi:hypothetical protein
VSLKRSIKYRLYAKDSDCNTKAAIRSRFLGYFYASLRAEVNDMSKAKDLTNMRFGKLIVLRRVDNTKSGKAQWLCGRMILHVFKSGLTKMDMMKTLSVVSVP